MSDQYLDVVIRAALTTPGAATSPYSTPLIGQLAALAVAGGQGDLITPYFTALPGRPSTFEVHHYRRDQRDPVIAGSGLNVSEAIRAALRPLPSDVVGVEIVTRDANGLARCVFVKAAEGKLKFLFPSIRAFDGSEEACHQAHRLWVRALNGRRKADSEPTGASVTQLPSNGNGSSGHGSNGLGSNGHSSNGQGSNGHSPNGNGNGYGSNGQGSSGQGSNGYGSNGHGSSGYGSYGSGSRGGAAAAASSAGGTATAVNSRNGLRSVDTTPVADLINAVRASLSEMTVEVDLQPVHDVIRQTFAETASMTTREDVAAVIANTVPTASDVADQVLQRLAPLLRNGSVGDNHGRRRGGRNAKAEVH